MHLHHHLPAIDSSSFAFHSFTVFYLEFREPVTLVTEGSTGNQAVNVDFMSSVVTAGNIVIIACGLITTIVYEEIHVTDCFLVPQIHKIHRTPRSVRVDNVYEFSVRLIQPVGGRCWKVTRFRWVKTSDVNDASKVFTSETSGVSA